MFAFDFSHLEYVLMFTGLLILGFTLKRMHRQAREARRREDETSALYALGQELTVATRMTDIIESAALHVNRALGSEMQILLPDAIERDPTRPDQEIIDWVYQKGVPAGRGTFHFASAEAYYHPLKTPNTTLGVMILSLERNTSLRSESQHWLLGAYANLIALAIERIQLADKASQAELLQEKERLHTALLNSISHDLRTPLASITGTLSSMLSHRDKLDQTSQEELLLNALNEAKRLNSLVANLLDMSRLESGAIKPSFEYCDIQDLIGVVLSTVENRGGQQRIDVDVDDGVPLVRLDFTLFERVLVNVLDNALKYSPPDSPIELTVQREDTVIRIQVADRGRGIPAADLSRIFERFERARSSRGIEGTGLGLAICKGIVELHGGHISASRRVGGGTIIQIDLPLR
jgi:two-component system sensor histidine kinase KdpD